MAPDPKPTTFRNQLLRALSAKHLALLTPHLTPVELVVRKELEWANSPIKRVFFPEGGIASVVSNGARTKQVEVGLIGREGMTGLTVVLGNDRSPHATYVQVAGHGQCIAADDLRKVMQESPGLRDVLLHFVQAFMVQTTHTAISNAGATLEQRLARWLLMAHDRIGGDGLPLIHEFLALMLGVRRPGVTVAIHSLEGQGLIQHGRGRITVIDRKGLEECAGASYGIPEAEYERLMKGH